MDEGNEIRSKCDENLGKEDKEKNENWDERSEWNLDNKKEEGGKNGGEKISIEIR